MIVRSSVRSLGFSIALLAYPVDCQRAHVVACISEEIQMTNAGAERQRLRELIEGAGVAMLMNVDENDRHVGRPMLPLLVPDDPHIYFLTHQISRKVTQLAVRPQVGLSIISTNCFIVVAGFAQLSRDPDLIRRLWSPTYRAWFPDGKDDREATAIRVVVDRIDYWEPPSSRVARLVQAVKAVLTRRAVETPMKTLDGL
jgi:general stress protein 26